MSINFDQIKDWQQTTNETTNTQGDPPQTSTEQIVDNVYLNHAKQERHIKKLAVTKMEEAKYIHRDQG